MKTTRIICIALSLALLLGTVALAAIREPDAQLIVHLPEAERRVVELKLRERSDADISAELRISPLSVRLHWYHAQQRLRSMAQNME